MTPTTPALAAMLDVPLEVAVEVGRVALPLGDILALQPGAVVELERVPGEPLDLLVNGHPVAKGEIVVINDTFAFRVTQVIGQSGRSFDYADEAMTGDER
jgi:flagellar motor switch protein FliN/FliY